MYKILLVDDVISNIKILSKGLPKDLYTVFFALNGKKALELVIQEQPDLILLDIMMPEMDGYEVCKQLKQDPVSRNIPVIFVTAKDSPYDEAYGLKIGAVDYISKPINLLVLNARILTHLKLKEKEQQLRLLSMHDGLTGIANRRYMDKWLKQSWQLSKRAQKKISLIMIDIDFFKQYNDHYGHLAGDDCLKQVAESLSQNITRSSDLIARYGGEEFACILSATEQTGAEKMAHKLRQNIEELNIPHLASYITDHITISLGVACLCPRQVSSEHKLIELADNALYLAKHQGRNRIVCSSDN